MLMRKSIKIFVFTILLITSSSSSVIGDVKDIDEDSLTILNTHHWNDNQIKNKERNDIQNNVLTTNLTVFPNEKQYQSKNIGESLVKMLSTIFDESSMIKTYKETGIDKQTSGNENYDNYEYIKFLENGFPLFQFGYSKNINHNRFQPIDYKFLALIQSLINKFYEKREFYELLKETKSYSEGNENSTKPSKNDTKKILTRDFSNDKKFLFNQIKNKIIFKLKNMIKTEDERRQMININDRYQLDIFSELNNDDNSKIFASPELKLLLRKPVFQDNLKNYPTKTIITKAERFKIDYPRPRTAASKMLQSYLENEDETNIHSSSNYMKNGIKNSTDSITFKANDVEKENKNRENLNENSGIQNALHFEEINNFDPIFHNENKTLLINNKVEYEDSQKQFPYQFRKKENESTHKKFIREVPEHIYKHKNIFKYFNIPKTKEIGEMSLAFYPIKANIENDSKNIQENNDNDESVYKNIYGKSENFQKLDLLESVGQVNGNRTISIDNKGVFYLFPLTKSFGKYKIENDHLKKNIIQIGDEFLSYPFNRDYAVYIRNKRALLPQNTHRMQTTHFGLKENLIFKKSHSNIYPHIRNKRSLKHILTDRKDLLDIHTLSHLNHNISIPNHRLSVQKHLIRPKEGRNKIDQIGQASKIRNLFNEHRNTHLHKITKDHLLKGYNISHFHREPKYHNIHLLKDHGSIRSFGGHKDHNIHLLKDHGSIRSFGGHKDHDIQLLKDHGSIRSLGGHKDHNIQLLKDHGSIRSLGGHKDHNIQLLKDHGSIRSLGGHKDHNIQLLKDHGSIRSLGGHKDHNIQLLKDHGSIRSLGGHKDHNIQLLKDHGSIRSFGGYKDHNIQLLKDHGSIRSLGEHKDHNIRLLKDHIGIHPHGIIKNDNVNLFKDHRRKYPHGELKDQNIQLLKDHISTHSHGLIKDHNVHLFKDDKKNYPHGVLKIHKTTHPYGVFKDHTNIHLQRRFKDNISTHPHGIFKDHNIQLFKDHGPFRNAMTKNPFYHNFRNFEHFEDGNYFKIGNQRISDSKFNNNQMNLDSFSHLERTDPLDFNSRNFKEIHYDDFSKGFHDCKMDENYYDLSKASRDDRIRENIDYILLMSLNELIETYFPVLSEILSFGLMIQSDDSNDNINPMVFHCSKWHPSEVTFNLPLSQDGTQTKFFLVLFPNWNNYLNNIEKTFKSIMENQSSVINKENNTFTTAALEITDHENATISDAIDKVNETSNSETSKENPENPKPLKTDNKEVDKEIESNLLSKILSDFFKNAEQLKNDESVEKFISELKFLAKSERDDFVDKLEEIVNKLKENTGDSESNNPKEDDTKVKEQVNENPEESSSTKEENEDATEIISQQKM